MVDRPDCRPDLILAGNAMSADLVPLRRALLSVSDKSGLIDLASALHERGVELISTGGTAAAIRQAGLPVRDVSAVTEFPRCSTGG